jgi:membrane associated rhomboid family serine protease
MTNGRDLFAPKLGLTLPLCGLHFIFFFLRAADPERTLSLFAFQPGRALAQPWTFVTYQFLNAGPMDLFFGTLILYILGSALEAEWGTGEFTAFWAVATLGAPLAGLVTGNAIASGGALTGISMLFAFAWLYPDTEFLMFFVVPVKVKWLAWLALAFLLWDFGKLTFGGHAGLGLVHVAGSAAGFLFFWVRHHGRFKAKKAAQKAVVAVKTAGVVRADAALERRNRDLFPRVEDLRRARREGEPPPRTLDFEEELRKLVVPGVNVCKPVDFKGDQDLVCLRCEGFAECSLRYADGQPERIVVKERNGP